MAVNARDLFKPGFTTGDPFDTQEMRRQEKERDLTRMVLDSLKKYEAPEKAKKWEDPEVVDKMAHLYEETKRAETEREKKRHARQIGIDRLNEFISRTASLVAQPHAYLCEEKEIPLSATTPEAVFEAAVHEVTLNNMLMEFAKPMRPENMKTGDRTKDLHLEALQALADEIGEIAKTKKITAYLSGPVRLSVMHRTKGRTTKDMIGGEEFRLIGAHIADQTGALWLRMQPVSPEFFEHAEVSLEFAKEGHFGLLFDDLEKMVPGGIVMRCKELAQLKMREREVREMAEKQEQYADFGSW